MLAVGGVILVAAGLYNGASGDFDIERMELGQILVIAGAALLSWALMNSFRWILDAIPLVIGLFVLGGVGIYDREFFGVVGGVAIVSAWFWGIGRHKKARK